MKRWTLAITLLGVALLASSYARTRAAPAFPDIVLWAWERPVDLRQLDPRIGVAFLAQTIRLEGAATRLPRRQPLQVDRTTRLMAVTRIETAGPAHLGADAVRQVAAFVAESSRLPAVEALQVDFDALASERLFYRDVLHELRRHVGPDKLVSMTALASWCAGDRWLRGLPVDEAVPMFFRMGPFNDAFRALAASPDSADATCSGSIGVSLDEPVAFSRGQRRLYVFNPEPWQPANVAQALALAK